MPKLNCDMTLDQGCTTTAHPFRHFIPISVI
uniref:Uncharacterized protein n=1 Tax=Anguilla anguilla TaxID=7936 RepID=A0A0E9S995_ANGAN